MDTIKCPKCGAQQEIYVNSEGRAVCVFCGEEITELPDGFDPSEHISAAKPAESTEAEEAALSEGTGEAITADYPLTYDDVKSGLYDTGRISRKKTMSIVETALVAAYFAIQIYGFASGTAKINTVQIITMVIMAALIPIIWIMPVFYEKKYIKSIADGTVLHVRVYEDVIYIDVDGAEKSTVVKLDGTSSLFDTEKYFFIVLKNGSVIILPKEHFSENADVLSARLKAGTAEGTLEAEKKKNKGKDRA